MRVETLTPVLDAAPGELVLGRVRVVNDGSDDARFTMRIVGLGGGGLVLEVPGGAIPPGSSAEVEVPLDVPVELGIGQHSVALEVSSDRPDERPALAQLTVAIDSLERVQLSPRPSTVRAGRIGRFTLDVVNNEPATVDVHLEGGAPDVLVAFDPPVVRLHPGERGWVRGRIRARQRWGGESIHHVLSLSAHGRSSTTSTTMAYIQRPVVPGKARSALGAFALVALFLVALGGALWWWGQRDVREDATTPGTGQLDQPDGTGVDGAGDGTGGVGPGGSGSGGGPGTGDGSADDRPPIRTFTVVTGTVTTSGGDPAGVQVSIAPIELGGPAPADAEIVGLAGRSRGPSKIWSARHAIRPSAITPIRQTESLPSVTTDGEGVWRFVDIPIRQTYELVFSRPGYTTKSFVITPPADGSRVELDVELEPADGSLTGTVVGPDGPLGGVEIVVTDGTLTFRTTSATEASATGAVGSFALEGLSTPAVYTLTAERRGFGTEVVQLPFSAGQERSGVSVSMRAGVGSVAGRITVDGVARGGVTLMASNGDDTFTTTSLTEGDVGAYLIPRLEIPGAYTVTATLPGYITQTRRLDLTGNVGSVDFQLTSTTAGITGEVRGDGGRPLVGAGITVSIDDVGFRTTTAAAPVPGSFNIEDLPPGTYLVRIARFDYLPFAQQVTVRAGEIADLGVIDLEFTERAPIEALGSIAVRVFDSEDSDLTGATVSLYRVTDRPGRDRPIDSIADVDEEQTTFVFENVAVGTYRVRVTHPIHRTVDRRVSVGLGRENVEVRMLRLGQASGQIVTAGGLPLRDYVLNISRLEPGGTETLVESVTVVGAAQPNEDGEILWESAENSLVTGTYRITVVNQPPGHQVEPNQVLDPTVTQTPAAMLFRIPPDSDVPVRVGDIVADPLPVLGGRLYLPLYNPATRITTMRELTDAQVAQLADLEVTLVCGDATLTADVPPGPRNAIRPYPGYELPTTPNHFEFTPFALQDAGALGACTLEVRADGFLDVSVELDSPLGPVPGQAIAPQRTVNVALLQPANRIGGSVFWRDGATRIDLADVRIRTSAGTVVGAVQGQGGEAGNTAAPEPDTRSRQTRSGPDGSWELTGQLFGSSTYTFDAPNFGSASLRVVVDVDDVEDPNSRTRFDVQDPSGLVVTRSGDDLDVELRTPDPGPLRGEVTILTTRPTPNFGGVTFSADGVGPAPTLAYLGPADPPSRRIFGADDVAAGTWTVTFQAPPNHVFVDPVESTPPGTVSVSDRLEPGLGSSAFDVTLVELGRARFDVGFATTPNAPQPAAPVSVTVRRGTTLVPGSALPAEGGLLPFLFERLAVDPSNPTVTPVDHRAQVTRTGFDDTRPTVTLTDLTGAVPPQVLDPADPLAFQIVAGRDLRFRVTLPQYGTFTGTVFGFEDELLTLPAGPGDTGLAVSVVRVGGGAAPPAIVRAPDVGGASFTVSGPPGAYDVSVSHPFYEPVPAATPGPSGQPVAVELANTVAAVEDDPWRLDILPSTLRLTALGSRPDPDSTAQDPLAGARVSITPDGASTPTVVVPTDADGRAEIEGLVPGVYQVEVRRFETYVPPVSCDPEDDECVPVSESWDGDEKAFPVRFTLTVSPSATPEGRLIQATVRLPSYQGTITGDIRAFNSANEQVTAPAATVTRTYQPFPVDVDGTARTNTVENESDTIPSRPVVGEVYRDYSFSGVPGGRHVLAFALPDPLPPGYTLMPPPPGGPPTPTTITVDVDDVETGDSPTVPPYDYFAPDRTVQIVLQYPSGSSPDPSVAVVLNHPAASGPVGSVSGPVSGSGSGGTVLRTFTITNVPPRQDQYELTVTDQQAQPTGGNPFRFTVAPGAPTLSQVVPMQNTGSVVTINLRQEDASPQSPKNFIEGPATVQVFVGNQTTAKYECDIPAGSQASTCTFVATAPGGSHRAVVSKTGFVSTQETFNIAIGNPAGPSNPLVVQERHTVRFTVTDPPDDTQVVAVPLGTSPAATATVSADGSVFTFSLVPNADYRFEVRSPGHYTKVYPSSISTDEETEGQLVEGVFTTPVGGTTPVPVGVLFPRVVRVTVDGPLSPEDTDDPAVDVTARLTVGAQQFVVSGAMPRPPAAGPLVLELSSLDATPVPLAPAGTLVISAPGFRSQTFDVPAAANGNKVALDASASLGLQQFGPATLRPDVTTITGSVTGVEQAVTVTLRRDGASVTTVTTDYEDDDGTVTHTFEFTAAAGTSFGPGTYVVDYSVVGVGTGSTPEFVITATSPTTASVAAGTLNITERNVAVTFTITGPAPSAATVHRDGSPLSTTSTSAARTFTIGERTFAATYQVRAPLFIWLSRSLAVPGDVTVAMNGSLSNTTTFALTAFPEISGLVSDGDGPVAGQTVRRIDGACPDDPDDLDGVTGLDSAVTSGEEDEEGTYVLAGGSGGPASTHCLFVVTTTQWATLEVTVSDSTPLTGRNLTLVDRPPPPDDDDDNGDDEP